MVMWEEKNILFSPVLSGCGKEFSFSGIRIVKGFYCKHQIVRHTEPYKTNKNRSEK